MSAGGLTPGAEESLFIAGVIALVLVRRAVAQVIGTPLSTARLVGYAVFYALVFAVVAGVESLPVLPLWSVGIDVAAGALGVAASVGYVERKATVYEEGGQWMYRLGPLVPLAYVALFLGRLVLEIAIGIDPFGPSTIALSPTAAVVLEVVDALFGFSTGVAIGRNLGVYRAWRRVLAGSRDPSAASEPS